MSFNRNLKRVAGPTFVVNVRYDDHQMMRCKNNTNRNVLLAKGSRLDEVYDVKEQELLVALKANNGAHYMDGYTHCFSFANNFPGVDAQEGDIDRIKESILEKVNFIGVAATEYMPSTAYREQGLVAQVGGVVTVVNESHETIYPGSKVMLDVALRRANQQGKNMSQKGIPAEKIRFTVKKAGVTRDMVEKASANLDGDGVNRDMQFIKNYQALQERVIGKSNNYARHGDRLEIILQPRSTY